MASFCVVAYLAYSAHARVLAAHCLKFCIFFAFSVPRGRLLSKIGGFTPYNVISGEHVLFLASFHNNDVTLSQFQVSISRI